MTRSFVVLAFTMTCFAFAFIACSPNTQLELKSLSDDNQRNTASEDPNAGQTPAPPTTTPNNPKDPSDGGTTPVPTPNPTPVPTPTTTTLPDTQEPPLVWLPLSWESKKPAYASWSNYSFQVIDKFGTNLVNEAQDITRFCPKYNSLTRIQKVNVIGQIISEMTRYESGFNPLSRMAEDLGTDPVTGKQVHSEGLLQLSYQDTQHYKFCEFDWNKDKNLPPADPKKTILDPYKNLHCGIRILNQQVSKYKNIIIGKGAYWAVIKSNSGHHRINEITTAVKKFPICQ
mgnify:CR=1 FL=1